MVQKVQLVFGPHQVATNVLGTRFPIRPLLLDSTTKLHETSGMIIWIAARRFWCRYIIYVCRRIYRGLGPRRC